MNAGTKFSCAEKSSDGRPRDGHAEVIARRGLKRFLSKVASRDAATLEQFGELVDDAGAFTGLLHLYCSSCPCGNAVLDKPNYNGKGVKVDAEADALVRSQEPGAFASHAPMSLALLPDEVAAQPKYGRAGAPLSCSDKIAIWSCLGLQGSRLSKALGPVYLRTLVVGRKFNARRIRRAACCRLRNFNMPPFTCHHPVVLGKTTIFSPTSNRVRLAAFGGCCGGTQHRAALRGDGRLLRSVVARRGRAV